MWLIHEAISLLRKLILRLNIIDGILILIGLIVHMSFNFYKIRQLDHVDAMEWHENGLVFNLSKV
jgi:hypothetical protein